MKLMNALTVRGKLTLAFACVLCLMTFLGGFAVLQLSRLYDHTDSILAVSLPGVRDSLRMVEVATRYRVREYRLLVSDAQELALTAERLKKAQADFDQARAAYAGSIADDTDRELYAQAMARWAAYVDQGANALPLMQAGKADDARELVAGKEAIKRFDDMLDSVTKLADYNNEHAKTDAALAKTIFEHSRIAVIVSVLLATALALGLGWLIGRAITLPLRQALVTAEAVAGGDLTQAPMSDGRDEVAQLMRALGLMVTKLRAVVLEVRGGVESVTTASTQIATGNLDLSQRTEEQASNLQQAAASMEELTSTVQQNAHNARAAAQVAAGATDVALRGGQVVGNVVATMGAIKQSSTRIGDIIGVIDGIAFQTNILALNAAVEAARAGEQGRGFAVVAAEVRSLAQRSAQAAKEIKSLIEQSVEKVDNGSQFVDEAGKTMAEIVRQVQSMNDLVGEISTASVEQARGIEQVGQAVSQLDQVTQQNAALVEESAAAADSMRHQAVKLAETVALFKVGGDQHATPVSTASIVSKAEPAAAPV